MDANIFDNKIKPGHYPAGTSMFYFLTDIINSYPICSAFRSSLRRGRDVVEYFSLPEDFLTIARGTDPDQDGLLVMRTSNAQELAADLARDILGGIDGEISFRGGEPVDPEEMLDMMKSPL
jgi:hypothetical protein